MKKIKFIYPLLILAIILCSCSAKVGKTVNIGGVEYDEKFVRSGYYLDKASLSDAVLGQMLSKVTPIEKPARLGTVVLPDISKIEVNEVKVEETTDAMVEAEIERERDNDLVYEKITTKREAKMTDKVLIDFKGYMNGEEFKGGSQNDAELILGSGQFIPGFEEQIVGHRIGHKFTINCTFPEEYALYAPELAGKVATFDVTIKKIEEAKTPNLDDEFAKKHTLAKSTTMEEYKEEVKVRITIRNELIAKNQMIDELKYKLTKETKFDPTEEALAWHFSYVIGSLNANMAQAGYTISDLFLNNGISVSDGFKEIKYEIPEYIQKIMLAEELQKRNEITVNEEDVKKWFEGVAIINYYGNSVTYEDYKKQMGYEYMKGCALEDKTYTEVLKQCKLVTEKAPE